VKDDFKQLESRGRKLKVLNTKDHVGHGLFLLPPTLHVRKDHALSYSAAATADSLESLIQRLRRPSRKSLLKRCELEVKRCISKLEMKRCLSKPSIIGFAPRFVFAKTTNDNNFNQTLTTGPGTLWGMHMQPEVLYLYHGTSIQVAHILLVCESVFEDASPHQALLEDPQ
jgi:hypothetical protein